MKKSVTWMLVALVVGLAAATAVWHLRDRFGIGGRASRDAELPRRSADAADTGHPGHASKTDADPTAPATAEADDEEPRAGVEVSTEQQARIGLEVQTLRRQSLQYTIRAVGIITADERLEAHVHTRIPGYVEAIDVDAVGDAVRKGQVLYRLYSPELVSTQQEYVSAVGRGEFSARIAQAALERLALWDVPASQIARLKQTRKVQRTLAFRSPVDGFVVSKNVLLGMYVMPEMELYHLADLSRVWVIVTLYEHELPLVNVGDHAQIEVTGLPSRVIEGRIGYVYPDIELATRTAKARVVVENADLLLKPGMYATASVTKDLGEALLVPEDAVIDTGVRRLVFVQHGATRFQPREVALGPRVRGGYMVREGIEAGEAVVVRASFLIDAESRLQAALRRGAGAGAGGGHGGHGE